jgi:catechol 2,3-dioxygenase-like lactoylglutathione lyase family enzyme
LVVSINHVNIMTADLAGSIAFYTAVIGFSEGARPPFDFAGAWLYDGDRPAVHLVERAEVPRGGGGAFNHVAFAVDALDPAIARLDRLKVPYRGPGYLPGSAIRQCFFTDPNGIVIELQGP